MADFKALISLITSTVDKFNSDIPGIQKKMLEDVLMLIKQLDTKGDTIKVAGSNLKILTQVKNRLQTILLNPAYVSSVKDYVSSFSDIEKIQNQYFGEVESTFKPPKLATEIRKQAIGSVVNQLTETGLSANVIDKVGELLRKSVTSGGSYSSLSKQLTDFLVNNDTGDGQLLKYTKQISTDALNQFSGQYTQIISNDLGFEWFRYSGSNIETSRPFCLACTERKYFHISEMPKIIAGEFPEFLKYDGKINKKTDLPEGMIPGTDVSNFMVNRGGYNCGHQWRPCSENLVPMDIRQNVYATPEYQAWAKMMGKKVPEIIEPVKTKKEKSPIAETNIINLSEVYDINNIYDIKTLFKDNKVAISEWFNNAEFKDLKILHNPNTNGSTDMNGTISLSSNKARLLSQALNNIQKGVDLSIDEEMAAATMWHELWHNMNKDNVHDFHINSTQREFMELGNEFVSRKTLNQFFEKFGTKLSHEELLTNRSDTAYNEMVRNYDQLIKHLGASEENVLSYLSDKMRNGDYTKVKKYLFEAIKEGISTINVSDKEIKDAIEYTTSLSEKSFTSMYP